MAMDRRAFLRSTGAMAVTLAASRLGAAGAGTVTLAAVGDCMITRRVSVLDAPQFMALVQLLRSADVTFGNFEMTLAEADAPPQYHEGCAYVHLRADSPENAFIAGELKWAGMKVMSLANNHSLDFGTPGLSSTIAKFDQAGMPHAGTGPNLA